IYNLAGSDILRGNPVSAAPTETTTTPSYASKRCYRLFPQGRADHVPHPHRRHRRGVRGGRADFLVAAPELETRPGYPGESPRGDGKRRLQGRVRSGQGFGGSGGPHGLARVEPLPTLLAARGFAG